MEKNLEKKIWVLLYLLIMILTSSCLNEKKLAYFQKDPNQTDTIVIKKAYEATIQSGDILSIYVNSLSPDASSFFNPYSANTVPADAGGTTGLSQSAAPGFLVNSSGNITLPLIGDVPVNGLTTLQAHDIIENKLKFYLKEPTVIVRFLNYKISILGEVNKPGIYIVPNERITIPEAITMAGDITPFGKRSSIQIIRDVNNKKEFGTVNLSDRSVFSSPYYYLHANDIVYIQAGKSKSLQTDIALRLIPVVVSIATVLIVIFK